MPLHPFFDALSYPWGRHEAQAFHNALYRAAINSREIELLYQQSGGARPLTPQLPADLAWSEVLKLLTVERCLQRFCEIVIASPHFASVHAAAIAVRDAKDLLPEIVLPQGIVFLDRKRLRSELEKLSQPGPYGVLLVRGASGAGKSWTQQFINLLAADRGARSVYIFEGIVSTVRDVVDHLFTTLGDGNAVPTLLETEAAWYQRVCLKLQELAQKSGNVLWVVADDLGEYPSGPRLDRQIRAFFDQFGLAMANPAFAQWFRLVLLDYPEGPVPTKWRSIWCEDRPHENDVDNATISEFLLTWADRKQKQLGPERASELAEQIMSKADSLAPLAHARRPRLERIRIELSGVLEKL